MKSHKSSYKNELIRPAVVYNAARYLIDQPIYIEEGVKLNFDWSIIYDKPYQEFIVDPNDDVIKDDHEQCYR